MIKQMKFIYKIQKFMTGRYGPDELYHFLFKLYIFLFIINIFFIKSVILEYIELFIVLFTFYRFFSKKIYKRKKENEFYIKTKKKLLKPFKNIIKNIKDKNYIYKKCNKCKTVIRLPIPNSYGIKHTKCPKCKKRLTVFCFKKEKQVIIKKGGKKNV